MTPNEALEQVRALHYREVIAVHDSHGEEAWCPRCREHWPCETAAILDAVTPEVSPVTVETVDDVYRHFESGGEAFAVRDTRTQLWLVWDNEDGDIYATSWPVEGGLESNTILLDGAVRGDSAVRFPATVLTPATPERTISREQVEAVAEVMAAADSHQWAMAYMAGLKYQRLARAALEAVGLTITDEEVARARTP